MERDANAEQTEIKGSMGVVVRVVVVVGVSTMISYLCHILHKPK